MKLQTNLMCTMIWRPHSQLSRPKPIDVGKVWQVIFNTHMFKGPSTRQNFVLESCVSFLNSYLSLPPTICPVIIFISPPTLSFAPEGRPGMSDVSPLSAISGLSFDFTLLSPLLFSCLALLLFLSYLFLPASPFFWFFSPRKFFSIFR